MRHIAFKMMSVSICLLITGCSSNNTGSVSSKYIAITNPIDMTVITDTDITAYQWIQGETPPFQEISLIDSIRFFTEKGTGILVYAHVGCAWCERAVPVLDKAANDAGIIVYYIDTDKKVAETEAESDQYVSQLSNYLVSTFNDDEEGVPTFYVPEVVGIRNGEITDYMVGLPSDYKIQENDQMNTEQKQELYDKYMSIIEKTAD